VLLDLLTTVLKAQHSEHVILPRHLLVFLFSTYPCPHILFSFYQPVAQLNGNFQVVCLRQYQDESCCVEKRQHERCE
jgi:hypothetical protein